MEQEPMQHTVHSYDTERHRILCGIPGHTSASKHRAAVTCRDCLRLMQERATREGAASGTEDAAAPAG